MAIKLDLEKERAKDKISTITLEETPVRKSDPPKKKSSSRTQKAKDSSKKKPSKLGRPKGDPMVTRSIRIREDIYERLVKEHEKHHVPYNELMNQALDEFLK